MGNSDYFTVPVPRQGALDVARDFVWKLVYFIRLPPPLGVQTPMAQGRSTKIISMIQWIRTRRLSIKNSVFLGRWSRCCSARGPSGWPSSRVSPPQALPPLPRIQSS
jgi:hypothetical protein